MKFLGGNDDRNGRGGVGVGVDGSNTGSRSGGGNNVVPSAQDVDAASAAAAAAAVGYVLQQRPSPGSAAGVGPVGSNLHDAAAAEYAAHFAQKQQQTRWACGDEHGIDVSNNHNITPSFSLSLPLSQTHTRSLVPHTHFHF